MHTDSLRNQFPEHFLSRINTNRDKPMFNMRAVLTGDLKGNWGLVCCVIREVSTTLNSSAFRQYRYPQVILYEELLTGDQCIEFFSSLESGEARFADVSVKGQVKGNWYETFVPANNDSMRTAGWIAKLGFEGEHRRIAVQPVISNDSPYYPDVSTAARAWLLLTTYHGDGDGRNEAIQVLLPETRAFIKLAEFESDTSLNIAVEGTEVESLRLKVKGAYWIGNVMQHIEMNVIGGAAVLAIPHEAERIDIYLLAEDGTVFDFHREDGYSVHRISRKSASQSERSLQDQVRNAQNNGEGMSVEFKPFVDSNQFLVENGKRTKLREILVTAVAFANAEGGKIFIGINDDGEIIGINAGVGRVNRGSISRELAERYMKSVRERVQRHIRGDAQIEVSAVEIDEMFVGMLHVFPSLRKPVVIEQDDYFYMRAGASNRKIPPDQWRGMLDVNILDGGSF